MHTKINRMLALLLAVLLLCGCSLSNTPVLPGGSQISSDPEANFYMTGLRVNEGERKESGAEFEDGPVQFQDPVIEEMLRTILGKPEGDVMRSELQSIHAIYWRAGNRYWSDLQSDDGTVPKDGSEWHSSGQPQTLADLALCDNLQWLEIGTIELPSLEPLYALTQLEYLDFTNTVISIERWEELARLPALTGLTLDFRDIGSDRTGATTWNDSAEDGTVLLPLADQLTILQIRHKLTWSPEVLEQFSNLERLSIAYPDDLSFLRSMPNLRDLTISDCSVSDWSALAQLPSMTYLQLIKCKGFTLEDLGKCDSLEQLILVMCDPSPSREEVIDAVLSLKALKIY